MLVIALLAAICMFATDVLATLLTQAEARDRAHLAALLDSGMWVFSILTTAISVKALLAPSWTAKILVVIFVSVANYSGTFLGTVLGQRFVKRAAINS